MKRTALIFLVLVVISVLRASREGVVVLWGIVPSVVATGVIFVSVRSIGRGFGITQFLLGIPTIAVSVAALWILKRMFIDRAWPTYLPYYAIGATIPIVSIQAFLARAQRNRPAVSNATNRNAGR
jgi:hypothetical protein